MSGEDLAKGHALLEDDEVKGKVASGDLSPFAGLELTDEESSALVDAAQPEVVGLGMSFGLDLGFKPAISPSGGMSPMDKPLQDMTNNAATVGAKVAATQDAYLRS